MVLAVLVAFGAVVGASEGIQASQRRARREEHRSRKNNLVVHCTKSSAFAPLLEGRRIVLSGGCLYIDTSDSVDPDAPFGHPFAGYFLPYPDAKYAGLVSTITDVAPIMNWVFVDRTSYALCYGARAAAEGQYTGPWDCTRQDRRLTFGGWEGFVAVRLPPEIGGGFWQLFFDRDADRMQVRLATMPKGTVAVEVELARRELRTPAPPPPEEVKEGEEGLAKENKDEAKDQNEGEKEAEKAAEKATEKEGQLTAEQVAELQRRLQAEEEEQKRKLIEETREKMKKKTERTDDVHPQEKSKPTRKHSRGSTRPATPEAAVDKDAAGATTTASSAAPADTTVDTDTASTRSRRNRRSNRSRRSNTSAKSMKSTKSTKSAMSDQSAQSSAQHSIRTAGTTTTKSTATSAATSTAAERSTSRNSNMSSSSSRRKDTDTDEDGGYSSSVYSGYFDSSGYPATPDENGEQ